MHEEVITTTSSSKFSNVNSTSSLHPNDGTVTVSIVHPQQHSVEIGEYIASNDCSTLTTSQIIPSQSSSDLTTLKSDVSSVIINGSITNSNDPNVLIIPATETCDSDKNTLTLSNLHADQVELEDLHDSVNDETSSREEGRQNLSANSRRYVAAAAFALFAKKKR
jgi:hypothetical protein